MVYLNKVVTFDSWEGIHQHAFYIQSYVWIFKTHVIVLVKSINCCNYVTVLSKSWPDLHINKAGMKPEQAFYSCQLEIWTSHQIPEIPTLKCQVLMWVQKIMTPYKNIFYLGLMILSRKFNSDNHAQGTSCDLVWKLQSFHKSDVTSWTEVKPTGVKRVTSQLCPH